MDLIKTIIEIEDLLIPHYEFDIWERGLYLYLLNQTRIRGFNSSLIPLSTISKALNCSDFKSRKTIRALGDKGVIKLQQTRKGHCVKVLLPCELGIQKKDIANASLKIEEIDFYKDRKFIVELIDRENGKCFYCLSEIDTLNCELDHVVSQQNGGGNSYINIVAACHWCNTRKQSVRAEDYLKILFRKNLLNESEFEKRLFTLATLKTGALKPQI